MDISTGTRGWLAHINQSTGPKVGKYQVNLTDLDVIGAGSLVDATKNADAIAIDEIGPMELLSEAFSNALTKAVESAKPVLGTIHFRLDTPLVKRIKLRNDTQILTVTYENREDLHTQIVNSITKCLPR
jgi:nucleoside-triphosphatase